ERVQLRRARRRGAKARVELVDDSRRAGVTGADRALEALRAVAKLLEIGIARKAAGWHKGLLSPRPGVRNHRPERRHRPQPQQRRSRWASPFPRTGNALPPRPI